MVFLRIMARVAVVVVGMGMTMAVVLWLSTSAQQWLLRQIMSEDIWQALRWEKLTLRRHAWVVEGVHYAGLPHHMQRAVIEKPWQWLRGEPLRLRVEGLTVHLHPSSAGGGWYVPLPSVPEGHQRAAVATTRLVPPMQLEWQDVTLLLHSTHSEANADGELSPMARLTSRGVVHTDCRGGQVTVQPDVPQGWQLAAGIRLAEPWRQPMTLEVQPAAQACQMRLTLPDVAVTTSDDSARAIRLQAPEWQVTLPGQGLLTFLTGGRQEDAPRLHIPVMQWHQKETKTPAWQAMTHPLTLDVTLQKQAKDWWLEGALTPTGGKAADHAGTVMSVPFALRVAEEGGWQATSSMPDTPLTTLWPGLQAMLPMLSDVPMVAKQGSVQYQAIWDSQQGEAPFNVQYRMQNAVWQYAQLILDGVQVRGALEGMPLRSVTPTEVKVASIPLQSPLRDGQVGVLWLGDSVRLTASRWQWAGGTLQTEPLRISIPNPLPITAEVRVQQVDVEQLAGSLLKGQLVATGRLNGTVPVTYSAKGLQLQQGELSSSGDGHIRYIPAPDTALASVDNAQMQLVRDALKDFQYEQLEMHLSSDADEPEKLTLQLKLQGRNAAISDARPIHLNVRVTGHLMDILGQSLYAAELPAHLQQQLQQQVPKHANTHPSP